MTLITFGHKIVNEYGRTNYRSNGILISEFEFYNKAKSLIPKTELEKIKKKLDNNAEESICWSNETFIKHGCFFSFYMAEGEKEVAIHEFDLKLKLSDIEGLKAIFNEYHFLKFDLTETETKKLREVSRRTYNDDYEPKRTKRPITHNDFSTLIDYVVSEKLLNGSDWTYKDGMKDLYKMFINSELPTPPSFRVSERGWNNKKVFYILQVIERRINDKNYRTVCFCKPDGNREYCEYKIRTYEENHVLYQQMDLGRLVCGERDDLIFLDAADIEYDGPKVIVNRNVFTYIFRDKDRVLVRGQYVIPPMVYRFYKDRVVSYEENTGDDGLSVSEMSILTQYRKILTMNKTIKMENLTITKKMIKLNNENFTIEFDENFLDIVKNLGSIKKALQGDDVRYNFNTFYERLLELSCLNIINMDSTRETRYRNFPGTKFVLNDLPIEIKKVENRIKINGIFCRIADVHHILSRAICYTSIDDYNKYLKDVSYIGADWMKMISSGVAINLSNPFHDLFRKTGKTTYEKVMLRFSLLRDARRRGQVYLMLNETRYPVKYKGKFKKHFNYPRLSMSLKELKNKLTECIDGIDENSIVDIVDNAAKEAKIIQKRGEELVRETVKDIQAKEGEYDIGGTKMTGYMLIGKVTNSEYFIKKSDLAVFKLHNGSWNRRCVVDDYSKQRIFEDRLANRLVNIFNEPRYIYTLH